MTERDLETIERWVAEFDGEAESASAEAQQVMAGTTALLAEVRRLRAALAHYADEARWESCGYWMGGQYYSGYFQYKAESPGKHAKVDGGGRVARAALGAGVEVPD
jgi:hypothetical protein